MRAGRGVGEGEWNVGSRAGEGEEGDGVGEAAVAWWGESGGGVGGVFFIFTFFKKKIIEIYF